MRKYITDNGYEMMLPDTDERVMTSAELEAKYSKRPEAKYSKRPEARNTPCPKCHTYCYGDCSL